MTIKRENKIWLFTIIGWVTFYFAWLLIWPTDNPIRTTGGNFISLLGTFFPVTWIASSFHYKQLAKNKRYWQLLLLASVFYFLAEACWTVASLILPGTPSSPGIYDFFYVSSGICYFFAFSWRIFTYAKKSLILKFLFDILVILSVSLTLSWYYIIEPLVTQSSTTPLSTIYTALFYLIGDIVLILCVSIFYFGGEYFFYKRTLRYITMAISIQLFTITMYFIESTQNIYVSGSWFDPLFILPVLLLGYTALIEREITDQEAEQAALSGVKPSSIARLILPYALVIILFIFMINQSSGFDVLSVGSGISIILVILRQFVVIFENKNLVDQYLKKTEQLEVSEERYRSLFEYHPDSVFSLDLNGKIESLNTAGASLLGKDQKDVIGVPITNFIDAEQLKTANENFVKVNSGWINSHEFSFKDKSGKMLWIDMTHIPILVRSKLVGSFGIGQNITENKMNQEKVHFYAYHDYLTGLANRRAFEDHLQKVIEQAEESNGRFSILFLDLDKFKEINDVYGHAVGDDLLTAIAERIKDFIGEDDLAARLGGDEFTILLNDVAVCTVQDTITELFRRLNEPYAIHDVTFTCSASIGFASYPFDGHTATELLSRADKAMYRVKRSAQSFNK
ncbi:diguanylate cyclase domain-containing protein [Marinilactibacillus kalidii]|uniref:diguanylate cyclase domain-containing protein n=1 Tax=Marinilactibacillus kalidii TaxID=2820274 RepID=UPI001ABE64B4|nr:diguanylate cyclase [Marinilactibacillus kalidii]